MKKYGHIRPEIPAVIMTLDRGLTTNERATYEVLVYIFVSHLP